MFIKIVKNISSFLLCITLVSCSGDSASVVKVSTLTVTAPADGKIMGIGVDCSLGATGDCAEVVDVGTSVTLTAAPALGYRFGAWTDACVAVTAASCTVTMSADKTVSATFLKLQTLTVTAPTDGKITGNGIDCGAGTTGDCTEVVDGGTNVVLTAIANRGYRLGKWIGCTSVTNLCSVTMSADTTVVVSFVQYPNERVELFIAHEGGAIGGYTYTDCLEALNLSYEKGARMFELDIIETIDGVFVSAHDWRWYRRITGSSIPEDSMPNSDPMFQPMSEQEFMAKKIYGKYSPLNMQAINDWFGAHADAILVTDKVNTPIKFVNAFKYKDRLIMELFTWGAVQEAIANGVKAMPTHELVFTSLGLPQSDIEKKLSDLKIEYVAISRQKIESNKDFLKRLKDSGIKAYAFSLDAELGFDEKYVLQNEMEWISGMYADNLDLILNPP